MNFHRNKHSVHLHYVQRVCFEKSFDKYRIPSTVYFCVGGVNKSCCTMLDCYVIVTLVTQPTCTESILTKK